MVDDTQISDEELAPEKTPVADTPDRAHVLAKAQALGYVSEEDWDDERAEKEGRKKPSHFITPEEFIERTENSLPIMRERMRHMEIVNNELSGKVNDMHAVVMSQREMTKAAVARSYEQGRLAAEAAMREAVIEGDTEKYDANKQRLADIDNAALQVQREQNKPADPHSRLDPITRSWVDQNKWFEDDYILNTNMIAEHGDVIKSNPEMNTWASLELAKRKLMKRYPEKFNINPNRDGAAAVSTPSGLNGNANRSNFDSLPQADKDAYERHRKMLAVKKVQYTKDEFMREYAL